MQQIAINLKEKKNSFFFITMNPQDSTQYLKRLDQITTSHVNTNTKNQFLMTPINISTSKTQMTNHIMIHLAEKKPIKEIKPTRKTHLGL